MTQDLNGVGFYCSCCCCCSWCGWLCLYYFLFLFLAIFHLMGEHEQLLIAYCFYSTWWWKYTWTLFLSFISFFLLFIQHLPSHRPLKIIIVINIFLLSFCIYFLSMVGPLVGVHGRKQFKEQIVKFLRSSFWVVLGYCCSCCLWAEKVFLCCYSRKLTVKFRWLFVVVILYIVSVIIFESWCVSVSNMIVRLARNHIN